MKSLHIRLLGLVVATLFTACTFDPVRPQAVYEATATARAVLAEIVPTDTPAPVPTATQEPEVVPTLEVGTVEPAPTPKPPCIIIKGNISASGEKIYHVPGGANYDQVLINPDKGEKFFCSEEEAVAAGWRKARR